MTAAEAALIMMSGSTSAVLDPLSVSENGTYTPREGVDGFNEVTVAVPLPVSELTVTSNGTYTAPDGTGYTPIYVNVPDNANRIAALEQQIAQLEQEKSELLNKVGYTFPEGMTMDDIKQLTSQGNSSAVNISGTGDLCIRVEFGYDESKIYPYSVTFGVWKKSTQSWMSPAGFRNPDPITFEGCERTGDVQFAYHFSDSGQYAEGVTKNHNTSWYAEVDDTNSRYTLIN